MNRIMKIIQPVAPTLASALNGPFASVATKYMADGLGIDSTDADDTIETIATRLNLPSNLLKIKELDLKFKSEMQKLDIDISKLEAASSEGKGSYALTKGNKPQIIISILFLGAYFLMLAGIFFVETSDTLNMRKGDNSLMGELQILFGVLTAGVGQVLSFWFGGSGPFGNKGNQGS